MAFICGFFKKHTNEFIYKIEIENQMQNTNLQLPGFKGGDKLGDDDEYTLLYIKYVTKMGLLCSTGRSTQYSVMTYMGKESKKHKYMYISN